MTVSIRTIAMQADAFYYAFNTLARDTKEYILLDSARGGKMSIAAMNPAARLVAKADEDLVVTWENGRTECIEGDPFEAVTEFVERYADLELPSELLFPGGVLGFVSYDYMRQYTELSTQAKNDIETPDCFFYFFKQWAVYDVENQQAHFIVLDGTAEAVEQYANEWLIASREGLASRLFTEQQHSYEPVPGVEVSITAEDFAEKVAVIQANIEQGEVIQVNLTVRQQLQAQPNPLALYEAARILNPSPYMALLGSPERAIVSNSPELLIRKEGACISTRPIGGTRRRGVTEREDAALEQELLNNTKEDAEHKMLVDLEQKEFIPVCETGTVEVDEYKVIERYSHVMHLVSNVKGEIAEGVDNTDVLQAVFPGGTITGDPKLPTLEMIEQLEPERRGVYTGSMGWVGFNGDMTFNILIRTAVLQQGYVYVQAGAGLVAQSEAQAEYEESLAKAQALWQALAMVMKKSEGLK